MNSFVLNKLDIAVAKKMGSCLDSVPLGAAVRKLNKRRIKK